MFSETQKDPRKCFKSLQRVVARETFSIALSYVFSYGKDSIWKYTEV